MHTKLTLHGRQYVHAKSKFYENSILYGYKWPISVSPETSFVKIEYMHTLELAYYYGCYGSTYLSSANLIIMHL